MIQQSKPKINIFLLEMLITIFFFIVIACISIIVLLNARRLSNLTVATDSAAITAQTNAEGLYSYTFNKEEINNIINNTDKNIFTETLYYDKTGSFIANLSDSNTVPAYYATISISCEHNNNNYLLTMKQIYKIYNSKDNDTLYELTNSMYLRTELEGDRHE